MEALGLGIGPLNSLTFSGCDFKKEPFKKPPSSSTTHYCLNAPCLKLRPAFRTHHNYSSITRMQAVGEDFELKQMKDMAAARKRWETLVRDEKVKVLTPRESGYAIQLSDKTLLDVRPSTERKKAWIKGSTWIPIFEVDSRLDAGTLSRKVTNFMMGGWWSGVPTLSFDNQFLSKVEEKFPKDTDLIVACQKGLRPKHELIEAIKITGTGSGGLSEFLGWTDQQRVAAVKEGWAYRLVFSARLVGVFLVADALFIGAQQVGHYLQDIRTH